jgi:hypothetical protein
MQVENMATGRGRERDSRRPKASSLGSNAGPWPRSVAAVAALLLSVSATCVGDPGNATSPAKPVAGSRSLKRGQAHLVQHSVAELVKRGWKDAPAEAVVRLNSRYFQLLQQADPKGLKRHLAVLGRLGNHPSAQMRLEELPELAGLLAGALEVHRDAPAQILKTLRRYDDRPILLTLYGLNATSHDCMALARTLERDGDLVARLCRRGAYDATTWFEMLPDNPEARRQYREWLRDLVESALRSPDEHALDRAQAFLAIHSRTIRTKLDKEPHFRRDFLRKLWPRYVQILTRHQDETWGVYVYDLRVWEFLARYGRVGAELFESHGPLAVDLLISGDYRGCEQRVLEALKCKDQWMIDALYDRELRQQPLFKKLLKRDIPGGALAAALHRLARNRPRQPTLLRYYDRLDDQALKEELGRAYEGAGIWLPGYSIYYLARKYAQGRGIDGMDIVMATVDAAEIVLVMKGASKGLKLIQQGVKTSLKKRGLTEVGERAGKATARELFPWTLREAYQIGRQSIARLQKGAQIDITDLVRLAFKNTRTGRETFRRITKLEARIFMRGDRRVAFDLGGALSKRGALGILLHETAVNAGFDTFLRTKPGQQAAQAAVRGGVKVKRMTERQVRAWKEHIAAWWLANATGCLDRVR